MSVKAADGDWEKNNKSENYNTMKLREPFTKWKDLFHKNLDSREKQNDYIKTLAKVLHNDIK